MTTAASLVCPGCGRPRESEDAVCGTCGTPPGRSERRLVTLLFADLAGYTSLCEGRDPEEVHLLVRPIMNALRRVCESRGAVVPSIEGDGFLAAFGARVTHEDDPLRALAAAAQMQQVMQQYLATSPALSGLHVAVHGGHALVAPSWEPSGFALSGDVVNVCRRLCSEADVDEVLVSELVHDLAAGVGEWGPQRVLALRGRDETVAVRPLRWRQAGPLAPARTWGSATPYLARPSVEEPLRALLHDRATALVVGEAGTGKSRLVRYVLGATPHLLATCGTTGGGRTRAVAADLLGQVPEAAQLAGVLRGTLTTGEPAGEESLLDAAARALHGLPADTWLVVEDLERLEEPGDVAQLSQLIERSGRPWLLVSRRPLAVPATVVDVPQLTGREAATFVDSLLPRASAELVRQVLTRAGAVPLFLEQCARFLLENGAVVVDHDETRVRAPELLRSVPTSMNLFVSSRLDLLSAAQRVVVDVAAVLGDVPDPDLLRHLSGMTPEVVEELVDRNILRWGDGPLGAPELRFCHALVRDVAYERLPRSRRVEIHRAAAEWYASLPAAQVLEAQAHHLEAAAVLGDADCDLVGRAVDALVLYARSVEEERTRAAHEALGRARALVSRHPACPVDQLQLDLCWSTVTCLLGDQDQAEESAARAVAEATRRDDLPAEAEGRLSLARAVWRTDPERAEAELARADEVYAGLDDGSGRARVGIERAILRERREGLSAFLASLDQAYALALRAGDRRLQVAASQQLALHHAIVTGRGPFEEWAERARELSRPDDVGLEPRLDLAQAALAMMERRPQLGLEPARRALQAARELGLSHVQLNALLTRLDLLVLAGDLTGAQALLPLCREMAAGWPTQWLEVVVSIFESRLRVRLGDPAAAESLLRQAGEDPVAELPPVAQALTESRAWVALERGDFEQARAQAVQSVLLAEQIGERVGALRPRLLELLATVALGEALPLGDIARLRSDARETGLTTVAELASRWIYVDDLTRGWPVDLHGLSDLSDVAEARALDLEIEALSTRSFDRLLDAAAIWSGLGTTVWQVRALLWHSELTGTPHPEADQLLEVLQSPPGLGVRLRAQVRELRG